MSTKPKRTTPEVPVTPSDEDILDPEVPDSLDLADFPPMEEDSSVEARIIEAVLSLDLDPEEIQARHDTLTIETGLYIWKGIPVAVNPKVTVAFSDSDIYPDDIAQRKGFRGQGRCYIKVAGVVVNLATKKEGNFEFSGSPDLRRRDDETHSPDFFTKNYIMAEKLYFSLHEKSPQQPTQVVELLKSRQYAMYITKGRDRNYLNRLQPLPQSK